MVDKRRVRLGAFRSVLIGLAMGLMSVAVTMASKSIIGVDLPFAFGMGAVVLAAVLTGSTSAIVVTVIAIGSVFLVNADHPLVTVPNTSIVFLFCLALAVLGGNLMLMRDVASDEARRLARRESLLESIFDTTPAAMLVVDDAGMVLAANVSASVVFGLDRSSSASVSVGDLLLVDGDYDSDRLNGMHSVDRDGTTTTLEVSSVVVPFDSREFRIFYLRDLTRAIASADQISTLHGQVQQLSRATALGQLGSAIAHELNQPLANAVNFAEVARMSFDRGLPSAAVDTAIQGMVAQVFRASAVLKGLRDFVRRGPMEPRWMSVSGLLADSVNLGRLAARQCGASIAVEVSSTAGEVLVDPVQIQQVVLNLVVNACEAVAGRKTRRVLLSARESSQDLLEVVVSDTGPGVSLEMSDRLFRPFQTTKPEGMGVGLSISRTIVEAHGGVLSNHVRDGGGASFGFTLRRRPLQLDAAHA